MKKHFFIILTVMIAILSFSSCGHEHAWSEWKTVTDATCSAEGLKERVCECGEKETQPIQVKEHTPGAEATCTQAQKCLVCNADIVSALGHKPPETISCTVAQTCTRCNTELAAATGHKGEWHVIKPATKIDIGLEEKKCTACGQKLGERVIPAIGSQGLAYTVNADGKTCTLTGLGTCNDSDIIIPELLDGYTVTDIASRAFYQCETITSVKIPATVQTVGTQIFFKASNLKTVYYNGDCTVTDNPFANTSVEKIVFSGTEIPSQICKELTNVREIVIEDSVIKIGSEAFYRSNVNSISFGNGLEIIGDSAFFGCKGLVDITLPNSVISIGEKAFRDCTRLTNITIPTSVTSIGEEAFGFCVWLKSVIIPDSVTKIERKTFYSCPKLTDITIPDSVTHIADEAFSGCTSLNHVTLPKSLTEIGENAFTHCTSLTTIRFSGTGIEWNYDVKKGNLGSYIPTKNIICSDGETSLN